MIEQTLKSFQKIESAFFQSLPKGWQNGLSDWLWHGIVKGRRALYGARFGNIPIDGGLSMVYLELGDRNKPTVVFLHGFSDSKDNFLEPAALLARHFHVVIPDLPGFGESSKPNTAYTIPQFAAWLDDFLGTVGETEIHLIGNSMGGGIATLWALDYGLAETSHTKILSLGLVGAGGVVLDHAPGVYAHLKDGVNPFGVYRRRDFFDLEKYVFTNPLPLPAAVRHYMFRHYQNQTHRLGRMLLDMTSEYRDESLPVEERMLNHRVSEINVPVALLWGDNDNLVPVEVAHYMHEHLPSSQKIIFENTGHCPQIEKPLEFYRRYRDFVKAV